MTSSVSPSAAVFNGYALLQRREGLTCGSVFCRDSSFRNARNLCASRIWLAPERQFLVGRRKFNLMYRPEPCTRTRDAIIHCVNLSRADRHVCPTHRRVPSHQSRRQLQCCAFNDKTQEKAIVVNDSSYDNVSPRQDMDCVGTGTEVECLITDSVPESASGKIESLEGLSNERAAGMQAAALALAEVLLLVSPFFFWGTAMVAMKTVLPKAGNMFVAATRLIPSGMLLVGFAASKGRPLPSSATAWLAIALFAVVDGACFQGFLAEGLGRTSAGLGSVIIDSQPLTVAVLAALFLGESIGPLGILGLATGIIGLCLLEVPVEVLERATSGEGWASLAASASQISAGGLWESGEWWMLLAAQSMAVGTVMVPWICRYADPIMATGWHMVLGGVPLLLLSVAQGDPAVTGHISDLNASDWASLFYASVFGGAVGYGVFFYNANKGNLTRLSSLTFLTPMFAAIFGYIFLGETLTPLQLSGAFVTLGAIYFVNAKSDDSTKLPPRED